MNVKKGLWRLFLVSSVAIFVWGYFAGANSANKIYMMEYDSTIKAISDLDKPVCQELISNIPKKFPDLSTPSNKNKEFLEWLQQAPHPCIGLALKYDYAKALHDKEKRQGQVTAQDFKDEFEDTWGNYRIRTGAFNGWITLGGYWILLAIASILFFIARWVFKGFKN